MIRPITLEDAGRVAEIHVFAWRSAYRGIVSDEYLFNKMTVAGRTKVFEKAIREQTEETYVYDDGIVKGILTIGPSRDSDMPHCYELWGIYVDPFMQRQGIGEQFMAFTLKQAKKAKYKAITLWVLEENRGAIRFYENFGFRQDGAITNLERLGCNEVRMYRKL